MTPDRDDPLLDPLLDACLEEVLGGCKPPDLSARILQAWLVGGGSEGSAPVPIVQLRPAASGKKPSQRGKLAWQNLALVASILGLGVGLGGFGLWCTLPSDPPTGHATHSPGSNHQPSSGQSGGGKEPKKNHSFATGSPKSPRKHSTEESPKAPPAVAHNDSPPDQIPADPLAEKKPPADSPSNSVATVTPQVPPVSQRPYGNPSTEPEILSFVSSTLKATWLQQQITPAPPASESEWCRRVYVRLLGRIPTVVELKKFVDDSGTNKRAKLVDRLLHDPAYAEQFARNWAGVWTNVLIGKTTGLQGDSLADRQGLEQYLRAAIAANKPYDKLVFELLTATGANQPGAADFNGAVNFLLAGMNENATLATARTSRVFLGQQLQCAQCHQHPTENWSQHHYWALNSFFRQIEVEKRDGLVWLVNADFVDRKGVTQEGEVYYQTPNGQMKSAEPEFLDGQKIASSGLVSEVDRRRELAQFVIQSDSLPRALVNRLWSHFFGYGFTRPLDDMGPQNPPSQPELLDRLAREFAAHNYDLKRVMRWIVLSDPFSRSSQIPSGATADTPEYGAPALFSHYYTRQMPAEEVYNSLVAAAHPRQAEDLVQARVDWLAESTRPMGTDDAEEESNFNGGMRQSLMMMNGDLMRRVSSSQFDGLLKGVIQSNLKLEEKVEHLFLAALSRKPTKRELDATAQVIALTPQDEAQALESIWWALLNSNEFILDH